MLLPPDKAAQFWEQAVPVHRFLGVKVLEVRDGYCRMLFPYREEVLGDFVRKRWHGGIIATAIDSAGGAAAATTLTSWQDQLVTIDMRVDYLRGTNPEDIVVTGELVRSGNRVISTKMQVWQEDMQKLVAEGRGMFSVYRKEGQKGEFQR